ncbi:hypothetical protein [Microbacterium sp. MYb66]|uniref:hypothetical protein n=1 Tax=Microbacterium sp. MYb66 TaxID=1848692 RepID=UPI0011B0220B|nr:hypothetical protein [Microbacterium sp. MYb66]
MEWRQPIAHTAFPLFCAATARTSTLNVYSHLWPSRVTEVIAAVEERRREPSALHSLAPRDVAFPRHVDGVWTGRFGRLIPSIEKAPEIRVFLRFSGAYLVGLTGFEPATP